MLQLDRDNDNTMQIISFFLIKTFIVQTKNINSFEIIYSLGIVIVILFI